MGQVKIEKLIFGGQGLGRVGAKVVFVWWALPGEEVEYRVVRNKPKFSEGVVTKVITASPQRTLAQEAHYLSCSPWAVLPFSLENEWKQIIALETYKKIGKLDITTIPIVSGSAEYGYRNKIEYSFTTNEKGELSFSFFDRGSHRPVAIEECRLADAAINSEAQAILAWLRAEGVERQALKSLILRSNQKGEVAAALFVKAKNVLKNIVTIEAPLVGLQVYYSNPLSPASNPDELLMSEGQNYLLEMVGDVTFKYGLLSFFQVNVPVFEKALADIKKFVEPGSVVVDFYSGVGAIGLSVASVCKSVRLVENNAEATLYARDTIALNSIRNAVAELASAEMALESIAHDKTIILDPPRMGLSKEVLQKILAELPKRIVYLSCDVGTQARDLGLFSGAYKPVFQCLYNFFPHTPHIESLWVMDRISG